MLRWWLTVGCDLPVGSTRLQAHISPEGAFAIKTEQLQAHRIGQHLEPGRELYGVAPAEWFRKYRFATRLDRRNLHDPFLSRRAHIDDLQYN